MPLVRIAVAEHLIVDAEQGSNHGTDRVRPDFGVTEISVRR
jgi:hypothetical protein